MSTSLYALTGEYRTLAQLLNSGDFDEVAIADTIEASGITDQIAEKAQGCEMIARMQEADIPAIDAEIKRLQELKRTRSAKAEALRQYVLDSMQACGIQSIDAPLFRISIAKSPASVDVFDERQIPADYMTDPAPPAPKPNKSLIKKAIQDGFEVPGAKLVSGVSLRIK
jgi:hypothetical protein